MQHDYYIISNVFPITSVIVTPISNVGVFDRLDEYSRIREINKKTISIVIDSIPDKITTISTESIDICLHFKNNSSIH